MRAVDSRSFLDELPRTDPAPSTTCATGPGGAVDESESLSFPDGPRVDLDLRIADLVRAANEVMDTQGRLRGLIRASQAITTQLDLPSLLLTIVESAVDLSGARSGALGVVGPHGTVDEFIRAGVDAGDSPSHGSGTLEVPIRSRGTVYGTLRLSGHPTGAFSDEDEQLVTALASTAGFAVENARLFLETRQRQAWATASAEVTGRILDRHDGDAVSFVADRLIELAGADSAVVALRGEDVGVLQIERVLGDGFLHPEHTDIPIAGSLSEGVLATGVPARFTSAAVAGSASPHTREQGPCLVLPLKSAGATIGTILVGRRADRPEFTEAELGMAADFASQASVALAVSSARADQQRVALFEDRGRIARDLHDRVIQQLFGTGMQLQTILGALPPGRAATGIDAAVANLDASIAQIRTIIFTLTSGTTSSATAGRRRIIDLIGELAPRLGVEPVITFAGPIDAVLDLDLTEDVLAVVGELVTNAVKHASARDIAVRIAADRKQLLVEVTNAGVFASTGPRSGLANLEARARARGGALTIVSSAGSTTVGWGTPVELLQPA